MTTPNKISAVEFAKLAAELAIFNARTSAIRSENTVKFDWPPLKRTYTYRGNKV